MISLSSSFLLLVTLLQTPTAPGDAPAVDSIGGHPYVRLETRQATLDRMLDLLIPSEGTWGSWRFLTPFPFSGAEALGNGELATPHSIEDELPRMKAGGPGPDFNRTHVGKNGMEIRWDDHPPFPPDGRKVDLRFFDDAALNENGVAYAYTTVMAKTDLETIIPLGSDDGIRIWLNGVLIHDRDVPRGLNPFEDQVRFAFKEGLNHVLFKVSQGAGGWEFQTSSRAALDPADDAYLYYLLDRDFPPSPEREHYQVVTFPLPADVILEVGGVSFLQDGRPVVSTRRGDVYLIEGAYDVPPRNARFIPYAHGLHEVLGTMVRQDADGEAVYAVQRGELTRMRDLDGDDHADTFETYCDGWGVSGNYHEFAFGPEFDADGNAWVTLNVGFCGSLGKASVPYRGACVKIDPKGEITFVCDGLRSPNGICEFDGEFFYVDNQGDYVATNKLAHLKPGSWHGHPASLRWRAETEAGERPARQPPAIWFPYGRMGQSAADIELDRTEGTFGPFAGQLFVGDQLAASIMRVSLEKVEGHYQGACYPFIDGLACGVNRLRFATDGTLFVGQTDRGWGSVGRRRDGIERILFTGKVPFEIHDLSARNDGFVATFTQPIDPKTAADPASYRVVSHTYEYLSNYGAPEIDAATHVVSAVEVIDDQTVHLVIDGMRAGYVFDITMAGVTSAAGANLLHAQAWYTLINIPGEPPFDATPSDETPRVLFLSHSAGYVHDVVKRPRPHIYSLAEDSLIEMSKGRMVVDVTQDCGAITAANLKNYDAVVFYTTGELPISAENRDALFAWVRQGGAFVGVHSATDTWYDVPEYIEMIGGTFDGHPWHEQVDVIVVDKNHPSTAHLESPFSITDEIYQFRNYTRAPLRPLLVLDPTSVDIGKGKRDDQDYALAWGKDFGEGRVFYTALGHRDEVWKDERFRKHLVGGIEWAVKGPDLMALPPEGAIVLYNGGPADKWVHRNGSDFSWRTVDEAMEVRPQTGDLITRDEFGDFLLHVEFMTPSYPADVKGQARGNSGVYVHGRYEVQVLDSYGVESGMGDCGAVYSKKIPDLNVCRPPEHWQAYDIRFRAPRFDDSGTKTENARISVWHNGIAIHRDFEIDGPTGSASREGEGRTGPIHLQDHGNPVRYRNIWIVPTPE